MNGQIARTGFRYQDLYLLLRVLEIVRGAYQDAWDSATSDLLTAAGSVKTKFGIEANSRPVGLTKSDDGPPSDWDIFVGDFQAEELIEVKSGAISKADREVFWRRLRRELAQIEQRRGLFPALVIDPAKAGNLKIWKDLAQAALIYTGDLPGTRPPRVDSSAVF